ncbi:MAG: hypothetical protein ACWGNK_00040 [Desulfobacterales bacterium]
MGGRQTAFVPAVSRPSRPIAEASLCPDPEVAIVAVAEKGVPMAFLVLERVVDRA